VRVRGLHARARRCTIAVGMGDLAAETAVEGRDGRYVAELSRNWEIWGPNGGYLAVIALRAAARETPFHRPATFTCHFLRVARFDAAELRVTTLRATRRAASLRVSMTQDDEPILEAMVWMVADGRALEHDVARPPAVPRPEALRSTEELRRPEEQVVVYPFWQNLESRPVEWLDPDEWRPRPPLFQSWYRFRPTAVFDDPVVDAGRALLLIDTMGWPAAWRVHGNGSGWVAPSLDVAVRFHRVAPASQWLLCEATAPVATDGLVGGQATIWSEDGKLLASGGGQLLCRPQPSA
jgi:acyl-CoA thioesterase-2